MSTNTAGSAGSRSHDRSPYRVALEGAQAALLASLTRKPVTALPDIEVGQEARTKEWYVKSLSVPMMEGEGWAPWLRRMGEMARMAVEVLPQPVPVEAAVTPQDAPEAPGKVRTLPEASQARRRRQSAPETAA